MKVYNSFDAMFNAVVRNSWRGNLPSPSFDGPIKYYTEAQISRMSAEELEDQIDRNERIIRYLEDLMFCSPPDKMEKMLNRKLEKKERELEMCRKALDAKKTEA